MQLQKQTTMKEKKRNETIASKIVNDQFARHYISFEND